MSSLSVFGLITIFASLSVVTKSPVVFSLLKGLVTPGIVVSFGFRLAAAPNIEVELDEKVNLPARAPKPNAAAGAKIIVNVLEGGKVTDRKGTAFADLDALVAHIDVQRKTIERRGHRARLHLRATEGVHFTHVRKVIGAGAKAGVNEVIFVTLMPAKIEGKDGPAERREPADGEGGDQAERVLEGQDAALQLPRAVFADEQPDIQPFFIKLDSKGRVFANTGAAQELLEKDPEAKELKLLDQRIGVYAAAARLGDAKPMVQIYVEDEAAHGRVQDVMDTLRKYKIDRVTFTDLIDAE